MQEDVRPVEPAPVALPAGPADAWAGLAPRFDWRPSQRHLLELAAGVADRRWHLCAPPGAGKTLIGLELARRVGRPTLVLAPTTAIRDQWREAVAMFGAEPATFTADDVSASVPLRAVTYQLLGNPGDAAAELEAAAARIVATESRDPARVRREVRRHVRVLRRSLATGDDIGVPRRSLLGERTAALIDSLAASGVGCLVLDECHHLLDWWALVVGALVERLDEGLGGASPLAVVGLTATLPDPDSSREAENYRGLLGEVDAELQLAAMVAERAVAPWRDGVRVVGLTGPEREFLDDWTGRLCADLDDELTSDPFVSWAVAQITDPALDARARAPEAGTVEGWDAFWDRDPLTAAAVARWWAARGMALPAGFDPPEDVAAPFGVADRLRLVDACLHDPGAANAPDGEGLSGGPGGAGGVSGVRGRVEGVLRRYGLAVTTSGVRWGRSAADLVCARSSAKGPAAADILAGEARRRGERIRALVVVERDRATTPPAAARAVLGEDAGTVARVMAALCARGEVAELGVLAVTGRGAWADALGAERIAAAMNVACAGSAGAGARAGSGDGSGAWVRVEGCDIAGAVRLAGQGGGWTSARWLAAAEAALDNGSARVLVATRGLVGEGWDHPALNVLVDLSEVASSTATTQLRGRAIRLDPADPDKLASLWDVVVAHAGAPGDWDRLRRRHRHWWGPDLTGAVATGPAKLHPLAGRPEPPSPADARRINDESAAAVADAAATRAVWDGLDPAGVASPGLHVRSRRRRRVRTRSRGWRWAASGSAGAGVTTAVVAIAAASQPMVWPVVAAAAVATALLGRAVRGRRRDQAATLSALGEAVLTGLVAATSHERLAGGRVVVEPDPAGGWVVSLDGVPDDAAERWADALAEALGPLGTPRWMVAVGTDQAWRVPVGVGTTRAAAEAFARRFRSRVPAARLVRAGTPDATQLVLAASRQAPDELTRSLRWR